ncbi:MAG: tetratricopeptide repeat protein [Bacteroidetes bacterium]|nr:tetratricopeptide repeat protein [Bacteroidota bacterium]
MVHLVTCVSVILSSVLLSQNSSPLAQCIAEGDKYAEREFNNEKALQKYEEALKHDPSNYEVLWKLSRTLVDIAEHLPAHTEVERRKQLETYEQALEYANRAIVVNPRGSMGYVRRAIVYGRIALFRGVWDAVDLVKQTKKDCEKAIELDQQNATAYYVLARTHHKVCEKPKVVRWPLGLSWATMEDALRHYEKAITIRPQFIMYRLDCARAYIEQKEYEKAKEHLRIIPSLPKLDEDDDLFRSQAAELLQSIEK